MYTLVRHRSWLALILLRVAGAVLCLAWAVPAIVKAQTPPTESAVKAAYLFRFISYVEWPPLALPTAPAPIVIGVLGADNLADELPAVLAGRTVNGQDVVARPLTAASSWDGIQVLFVGRGADVNKALDRLGRRPVLVVTESALEPGGMLNFITVDGRIRFEAAPALAEAVGLKLGARLLAVSERIVRP
jgi:hypothetical protein